MPKQLGFDLYAMIVHYTDGTTCNCYARKTGNWYYFSDKMDFRIQLAGDNRTITLQQWRRTHYSSSWYESGLLDYVELMTFGETYLQSELNPMRIDIQNNHTTIVNNYNEYIENKYITDQTIENHYNEYNTFVNDTFANWRDNLIDYLTHNFVHVYNSLETIRQTIYQFNDNFEKLGNNFNTFLKTFAYVVALTWVNNPGVDLQVNSKAVSDKAEGSIWINQWTGEGTSTGIVMYAQTVDEGDAVDIISTQNKRVQALYDWAVAEVGRALPITSGSGTGRTMQNQIDELLGFNLRGLEAQVLQNTNDIAYLKGMVG